MRQQFLSIILLAVCVLTIISGMSIYANATPISDETSRAFFNNCLAKRDERMTEDHQKEFCACSAAKMQENMSMEETRAMFQPNEDGRLMLNKMLTQVYAPCMQFPVQDLITASCIKDPKIAQFGKDNDPKPLCACMGAETGKWFAVNGSHLLSRILQQNPNITDPITPVMESEAVKNQSFKFMIHCARTMK